MNNPSNISKKGSQAHLWNAELAKKFMADIDHVDLCSLPWNFLVLVSAQLANKIVADD